MTMMYGEAQPLGAYCAMLNGKRMRAKEAVMRMIPTTETVLDLWKRTPGAMVVLTIELHQVVIH